MWWNIFRFNNNAFLNCMQNYSGNIQRYKCVRIYWRIVYSYSSWSRTYRYLFILYRVQNAHRAHRVHIYISLTISNIKVIGTIWWARMLHVHLSKVVYISRPLYTHKVIDTAIIMANILYVHTLSSLCKVSGPQL